MDCNLGFRKVKSTRGQGEPHSSNWENLNASTAFEFMKLNSRYLAKYREFYSANLAKFKDLRHSYRFIILRISGAGWRATNRAKAYANALSDLPI